MNLAAKAFTVFICTAVSSVVLGLLGEPLALGGLFIVALLFYILAELGELDERLRASSRRHQ